MSPPRALEDDFETIRETLIRVQTRIRVEVDSVLGRSGACMMCGCLELEAYKPEGIQSRSGKDSKLRVKK